MNSVPFLAVNITALCCFVLLLATFLAAKKTPEIRAFMLLVADCILWLGGTVLMRLQMWPGLRFWFYVSLLALFAVEWFFYLFLLRFTRHNAPFSLAVWTAINVVELAVTATDFFLAPPTPTATENGTVFLYSMSWHIAIPCLFYVAFTVYLVRLIRRILREQGIHSPGLLLVVMGGCTMGIGNVVQIAIPGNTFPYDALCGIAFAAMMLLALYKKRMFRLTLVVSRSLLLVMLALICVLSGVYVIEPAERFLTQLVGLSHETATVMVAIIFAGILVMVYSAVRRLTDTLFTREEQQNRLLKQFSTDASQSLSTQEIMEKLSAAILGEIPAERVYVCLREGNAYQGKYCSNPLASLNFSISADSPQVAYLRQQDNYLIVTEFRSNPLYLSVWESEKELLRRLNIDCAAAMKDGDEVVGLVLLAAKERNKTYNYVEIGYLETVCSVASIAMKNAGLYEKMFREARIDELTGAYNYRYFAEQEEQLFEECKHDCLSLLLVDVDDMKLYNQLYGVEAGNDALRRICEEIRRCIGEGGVLFRSSGKVFAVLLPHEDTHRAQTVAKEIVRRIHTINEVSERKNFKTLTVSIGICSAPYAAACAKELLDNADLAAFNAKQSGKNQIVLFRGASSAIPQQLAERTDSIVNRIELQGERYRSALSMISALTAAIDAKDHYTYAHSKNVARYAANLAVAAGLNDDQVRTIYAAGLLHDIGKISVPEDILNKSGKLTDAEYSIMKDHVNNSIEMIRHLSEMDYLIPAALGHHERWDGKGYPRGIAGENIPVSARCLAIADVFDAMTTDRPYRKGLPLDYALSEIEKGEGTQFDPTLAAIFIQLVRGQEIKLASHDHERQ
ncbi:MAG: diguanylate cyclase [Oscillibacter sp.]|jgi:diguanylate cyclase (GGDEF)-like protein/putative nucleotidyltransferase with HDIG domain|nr:diguanylate cyclase [Oscillibacter sp.]